MTNIDLDAIAALAREAKERVTAVRNIFYKEGNITIQEEQVIHRSDVVSTKYSVSLYKSDGRAAGRDDLLTIVRFLEYARSDIPAIADAVLALVERVKELEGEFCLRITPRP